MIYRYHFRGSLKTHTQFYRNFMHISDVCRAIKVICENGAKNEIYNIGSMNNYLFKDIIQIAVDELKSCSKISSISPPDFHKIVQVKDMMLDTKKLYDLGFDEIITIEEGIKSLCKS